MASKTLIRTGASLMNRILSKPLLHPNPNSNHQIVSHGLEITPKLFPSLSNFDTSFRLPQNDAESLKRVSYEGLVYPFGLPYLPFFLPDGTLSLSLLVYAHFWIVRYVCTLFFPVYWTNRQFGCWENVGNILKSTVLMICAFSGLYKAYSFI